MTQLTSTLPRGEVLVTRSRVALALFSFFAIAVDPMDSGRSLPLIGLAIYSIYALTTAVAHSRLPLSTRFQVVTHVGDIAFFSWLVYMSRGHTSPFFGLFFFSMLCATVRFGQRGTLITALAVILIFISLGTLELIRTPGLELNRFLVRATSLAVIGWIL